VSWLVVFWFVCLFVCPLVGNSMCRLVGWLNGWQARLFIDLLTVRLIYCWLVYKYYNLGLLTNWVPIHWLVNYPHIPTRQCVDTKSDMKYKVLKLRVNLPETLYRMSLTVGSIDTLRRIFIFIVFWGRLLM